MPIAVVCPGCNSRLNAPDAAAGKTVKCPKCKAPMVIPVPEADPGFETVDDPVPAPKKPAPVPSVKTDVMLDDDEEDERPRKKPKGTGKKKAKGLAPAVLIGLIAAGVLLLGGGVFVMYWFGIRGSDAGEKVISFEVLQERQRKLDGKLFLDILVSEMATKDEVMKLAMKLKRDYDGRYAVICIFDAREAWQHKPGMQDASLHGRSYAAYSEKDLDRHWLVIVVDIDQEVRWVKDTTDNLKKRVPVPTPPVQPSGPVKPLYESSNAVSRSQSNNNLKQVGLAFHNFDSSYGALPAGIYSSSGSVGLSWRVAILPYLEQDGLYKQFKLNEPWDSENNKKLIPLMPKTFAAPGKEPNDGLTYYRSFTGEGTAFPPPKNGQAGKPAMGLKLSGFADGTSNTALVAEAGDPVIWTKPDELVYTPGGTLPRVGGIFGNGFHVVLGDGSTRFVKPTISPETLKAMITAQGGEIVDFEK